MPILFCGESIIEFTQTFLLCDEGNRWNCIIDYHLITINWHIYGFHMTLISLQSPSFLKYSTWMDWMTINVYFLFIASLQLFTFLMLLVVFLIIDIMKVLYSEYRRIFFVFSILIMSMMEVFLINIEKFLLDMTIKHNVLKFHIVVEEF